LAYEARQQREVTTKGSECSIPTGYYRLDQDAQTLCLNIPAMIDLGGTWTGMGLNCSSHPALDGKTYLHPVNTWSAVEELWPLESISHEPTPKWFCRRMELWPVGTEAEWVHLPGSTIVASQWRTLSVGLSKGVYHE